MRVTVGVTGASGAIYAEKLVEYLSEKIERTYLVMTSTAEKVIQHELASQSSLLLSCLNGNLEPVKREKIRVFKNTDLFAPIASGTSVPDAMIVVPCSMGTLGRIAGGLSSNLLERAADVTLKERKKLILAVRESPLHTIHLQNMTKLSELGAFITPLMPGFYNHPSSIDDIVDFMVGKILDQLEISHELYKKWNSRML
jgi:4-hydroxy-3-polyprenylbenzoate decarboxylase